MTDLLDRYDVLLADLDGTLYQGPHVVPGAVEAIQSAAARGVRTAYVTNNASRRPSDVARQLADLGFPATEADVVTSSQAAADMLAEQLSTGAAVLVVGTDALAAEITRVGLTVTTEAADAAAVVQGHSPDTGWRVLADASVALRRGAVWVACNLDPTLPTERGPLPGNGSMVAVLRTATGLEPQVAGKPAPALVDASLRRTGARRPLMIGDRLDTDIEGGRAAGIPALLVLTGVSDAAELLAAAPLRRPDFVAADLSGLMRDPRDLTPGARPGWTVQGGAGQWTLTSDGGDDPIDALLSLCGAHWADGGGAATVRGGDSRASRALDALGLSDVSATVKS